jgi:hypothetical protein
MEPRSESAADDDPDNPVKAARAEAGAGARPTGSRDDVAGRLSSGAGGLARDAGGESASLVDDFGLGRSMAVGVCAGVGGVARTSGNARGLGAGEGLAAAGISKFETTAVVGGDGGGWRAIRSAPASAATTTAAASAPFRQ